MALHYRVDTKKVYYPTRAKARPTFIPDVGLFEIQYETRSRIRSSNINHYVVSPSYSSHWRASSEPPYRTYAPKLDYYRTPPPSTLDEDAFVRVPDYAKHIGARKPTRQPMPTYMRSVATTSSERSQYPRDQLKDDILALHPSAPSSMTPNLKHYRIPPSWSMDEPVEFRPEGWRKRSKRFICTSNVNPEYVDALVGKQAPSKDTLQKYGDTLAYARMRKFWIPSESQGYFHPEELPGRTKPFYRISSRETHGSKQSDLLGYSTIDVPHRDLRGYRNYDL